MKSTLLKYLHKKHNKNYWNKMYKSINFFVLIDWWKHIPVIYKKFTKRNLIWNLLTNQITYIIEYKAFN